MSNAETIRWLETAACRAMPALWTRHYDGWLLRFAAGYTRRANAVTPIYGSSLDLNEKLAYCEQLYAREKLPLIFKLTNTSYPADLDKRLADRGYVRGAEVSLQTLGLERITAAPAVPGSAKLSRGWLTAYQTMNEVPAAHYGTLRAMLENIHQPTWYALLRDAEARPVAVGLGVITDDALGIFDIVVAADQRGKGIGTQLVGGLLAWGKAQRATLAYLQVNASNTIGQRLYARLGFQEVYRYWYRNKP